MKASLQVTLFGEPRLAYCYVRHDRRRQFETYIATNLSEMAKLYLSQNLVNENLYGLGKPPPELSSCTGDYTLVMNDGQVIIARLPGDNLPKLVGYQGGLSSQEVFVTLILVN